MIGNNTLTLNEATLVQAVQEWLDKRMNPSPKVGSVKAATGSAHKTDSFDVQLTDRGDEH